MTTLRVPSMLLAALASGCLFPVQAPVGEEGEIPTPTCTEGSCTCPSGWQVSGSTCVDVNECAAGNPCTDGKVCENTAGSYRCVTEGAETHRGIAIQNAVPAMTVGTQRQLSAAVSSATGAAVGAVTFDWESSAPNVASVSPSRGISTTLTAHAPGSTTVRAVLVENGQRTPFQQAFFLSVTATALVSSLEIAALASSAVIGETKTFAVVFRDANEEVLAQQIPVVFELTGSSVSPPVPGGGTNVYTVTAVAAGTTTLVARWTDGTNTRRSPPVSITVSAPPPRPTLVFKVGSECQPGAQTIPIGSRLHAKLALFGGQPAQCTEIEPGAAAWTLPVEGGGGLLDDGIDATTQARKIFTAREGTWTARAVYDGSTADLSISVRPVGVLLDAGAGGCARVNSIALDLEEGPIQKTLRFARAIAMTLDDQVTGCPSYIGNVSWSVSSFPDSSLRVDASTDPSQATVTALAPTTEAAVTARAADNSLNATVPVTVTGAPLTFSGAVTAEWRSAKTYQVTWTQAATGGGPGAPSYRVLGELTGLPTQVLAQGVAGLSATVTVPTASPGWKIYVEAVKGPSTSSRLGPAAIAPLSPNPTGPAITFVGDDGGAYAWTLDGESITFLGLTAPSTPGLGQRTAPRADLAGRLYALASGGAAIPSPVMRGAPPDTSTSFRTYPATRFAFRDVEGCSPADQPQITLFPVGTEQRLVYTSPNDLLPTCSAGTLLTVPLAGIAVVVADDVTSATPLGAALDRVAFLARGYILVIDVADLETGYPRAIGSGAPARSFLVGAGDFVYLVAANGQSITRYDPQSFTSGTAMTLAGVGLEGMPGRGYGLPSGELILPLPGNKLAVGTVSGTTITFAARDVAAQLPGVNISLGYLGP